MEGARASGFAEEVLPHSPKKSFENKGAEFPLLRFQPSQLRGVRRPHGSVGWSFENDGTLSAGAVWGPVAPQPRRRRRPVTPITVGGRRVLTSSRIDATYRPRRDAQREGPGRIKLSGLLTSPANPPLRHHASGKPVRRRRPPRSCSRSAERRRRAVRRTRTKDREALTSHGNPPLRRRPFFEFVVRNAAPRPWSSRAPRSCGRCCAA